MKDFQSSGGIEINTKTFICLQINHFTVPVQTFFKQFFFNRNIKGTVADFFQQAEINGIFLIFFIL
jgi:hypothetical protein